MAKSKSNISAVPNAPQNIIEKKAFCVADDVPITLAALEEIRDAGESLENTLALFSKSSDAALRKTATILGPAVEKISRVLSNDFPDLDHVRKYLIEEGLENKILN
jgi:hypothetical protein